MKVIRYLVLTTLANASKSVDVREMGGALIILA
jgi:hypothetical protein